MVKWLFALLLAGYLLPAVAASTLRVEAEFDVPEVPVHAQATYRMRFLHAVDAREVTFTEPVLLLADWRRIGEDRVYETRRDGVRYRARERRYAVFPFASGTLDVSGVSASARIPAAVPGGWQTVRLTMPARALKALPIDMTADGKPVLHADALTLTEQWEHTDKGMYRRLIRVEAAGVDAAHLPELDMAVDGIGVLRETPRVQNHVIDERNIAVREQTFVLMPAGGGKFTVPALGLPWRQLASGKDAWATLPARTLDAGAHAASGSIAPNAPATPPAALVAGVFPLGLVLLAGFRSRRRLRLAWQLRCACRGRNARAVRDGVLAWAADAWTPRPRTLGALAEHVRDVPTRSALHALDRHLYGAVGNTWTAEALGALVAAVKRDARNGHGRRMRHHFFGKLATKRLAANDRK